MLGKKRRSYLDQFHKSASGEYIYAGDHYAYSTTRKSRKRALAELWLFCGGAAAATLAGGCTPAPGISRCGYVILPYMASLIAAFSLIWTMGQLAAGGDPLRAYVYEVTVKKLPHRAMITAVLSGLTIVGEGIYLVLNGAAGRTGFAALFLLLEAAAAVLAVLSKVSVSKLSWTKA